MIFAFVYDFVQEARGTMLPLDIRKVRILQAIVNDYVITTKPVGSERLIEAYNLGCKSATVRNEMAEMAEMGYLVQPHTSAGRIPTDQGYRYYVNELMDCDTALSTEEVRRAEQLAAETRSEIEAIIQQTCRILSRLTSYTSLVTDPSTETTTVRRFYLSEAGPRRLLMVLLLSTGQVEHRLIEMETPLMETALLHISNYINTLLTGRDLDEIGRATAPLKLPAEIAPHAAVLDRILGVLAQAAHGLSERRVFMEGANQFLRQPEFHDVQRLESLLNALEQRSALYQMLSRTLLEGEVAIIIGTENGWQPMQECSVITTSYRIGTRTAGYLGVVGPTRMQYDRAAAAVNLMARNLSMVLTNLCIA
jgi:heat-inducible transcriptional repressor